MQQGRGGRRLGHSLRMISANLRNGGADPCAFAQLVSSLEADLVAVQEISPDQAEALSAVLPHGQIEPSLAHRGMGIALRRPAEITRVPLRFRDAHIATLRPDDWPDLPSPLEVINVHIAAPHLSPPGSGLLHRRRQMRDLEGYLLNGSAVARAEEPPAGSGQVLLGDFNATPAWPLYWRISSHFTDAARAVAAKRGFRLQRTWAPWSGSPKLLRIDHGFVRGLGVEEFQVVEVAGSDHNAIVMDLVPSSESLSDSV